MPEFTIKCSADKWPAVRENFLRAAPNQTLESNNPMSEDDWIKHKILLMAKGQVVRGKRMKQEEEASKPTEEDLTIE